MFYEGAIISLNLLPVLEKKQVVVLKHLSISNYALIETLEIDFYQGFSVITGETGAGKSIIMGALSLILGQRADLQILNNSGEKCFVEGFFDISHLRLSDFFEEQNLDYEPDSTILRREILPSGKSRAFVNDTPVRLTILKELAEKLVDIHSQNTGILLQDNDFQLAVVDSFAETKDELQNYRNAYQIYNQLKRKLKQLESDEEHARSEQDFFQFQYDELEEAKLQPGEQAEIEEELEMLNHAEEIKSRLVKAMQIMNADAGLLNMLSELQSELKTIQSYSKELGELLERIESSNLELQDISRETEKIEERVNVDPSRAEVLNERINLIYHLEQKHHVDDVEELIRVKDDYAGKLAEFSSLGQQIDATRTELQKAESELEDCSATLTKKRKSAVPQLEKQILGIIRALGMPDAQFRVKIETLGEKTVNGPDHVILLFNANKGAHPMEVSKIASGGEISRLMLAIKSLVASRKFLSTIIFDEIDSGVSGEVAGKMGGIMRKMSSQMQIISITHLPQIAARGNHHYLVYKENTADATRTLVQELPANERINEIAKMLSDEKISTSALETARELLRN